MFQSKNYSEYLQKNNIRKRKNGYEYMEPNIKTIYINR